MSAMRERALNTINLFVLCVLALSITCEARNGCVNDSNIGTCFSLDRTLTDLESDDILLLSPGTYTLDNFTTDVVRDISNVTIVGNVSDPQSVIITCSENVGLFFLNVSDLTIIGVTVEHCGIRGIDRVSEIMNMTGQIVDLSYAPLSDFSTAIYLAHCPNLELSNVIIRDNRGFGLVGINLVGNVTFHQLQVHHNYPSECVLHSAMSSDVGGSGGGMFLLYQNYVSTGSEPLDTQFQFSEIDITDNYVCGLSNIYEQLLRTSLHFQPPSLSIVGAGGLTFALAQTEFEVKANFETCTFHNNSGTHNGAAILISLFGHSTHSNVSIEKCQFLDNGQELVRQYGEEATGPAGALLLWQQPDIYGVNEQKMSLVTVSNCMFERNMAQRGGAVCVVSSAAVTQDMLEIRDSVFNYNMADLGSALYFTAPRHSLLQYGTNIHLQNVEVCGNKRMSSFLFSESGVIDASYLNISLTGSNYIARNKNTAMSLNSAVVTISGESVFEFNSGSLGGAISLTGGSYLIFSGTNVTFSHNSALVAGGAVHLDSGVTNFDSFLCDLIFEHQSVDEQIFVNNSAPLGSAVYGSYCPQSDCPAEDYILEHFNNGSRVINTPPIALLTNASQSNFTILPGSKIEITLGAFDWFNQSVPVTLFSHLELVKGTYSVQARSLIGNSNIFLIDGSTPFTTVPLRVFGTENSTYRVTISSDEAQVEFSFDVTLQNCPLGFLYNSTTGACDCYISNFLLDVTCNNNGSVSIPVGLWIGFDQVRNGFGSRMCLFDYCLNVAHVFLDNPDTQCRNGRAGTLCGQCPENHSRIIGSTRCEVCGNSGLAIILVTLFSGFVLVVVVAICNITITHGYINGILFYSNIMSLYLNVQSSIILDVSGTTSLITSINLFNDIESCFFSGATDLHLNIFSYFYPLYLGAILLVITLILKYCHTRCLAKILNKVNLNLTHLFATLLLMTYTRLIRTCNDLLSFAEIQVTDGSIFRGWRIDPNQKYFEGLHIFGGLLAIFFSLILLPFPLILLFPIWSLRIPYVRKLKPLVDAFIAPLAEGREFWVGFRLLCRVSLFLLILVEEMPRNIILSIVIILVTILQALIKPYKTAGRNLFDLFFMVNLTMISFLAVIGEISDEIARVAAYIVLALLIIANITIILLLVVYILAVFPPTKRLCKHVKSKLLLFWSKIATVTKAKKPQDEGAQNNTGATTQANLEVTTTSLPRLRDIDFRSTEYVAYRESLFETETEAA